MSDQRPPNALRSHGPRSAGASAAGDGISPTPGSISTSAPIAAANGAAVSRQRRSGEETTRVGRSASRQRQQRLRGRLGLRLADRVETRIVVVPAPARRGPGMADQIDAAHRRSGWEGVEKAIAMRPSARAFNPPAAAAQRRAVPPQLCTPARRLADAVLAELARIAADSGRRQADNPPIDASPSAWDAEMGSAGRRRRDAHKMSARRLSSGRLLRRRSIGARRRPPASCPRLAVHAGSRRERSAPATGPPSAGVRVPGRGE